MLSATAPFAIIRSALGGAFAFRQPVEPGDGGQRAAGDHGADFFHRRKVSARVDVADAALFDELGAHQFWIWGPWSMIAATCSAAPSFGPEGTGRRPFDRQGNVLAQMWRSVVLRASAAARHARSPAINEERVDAGDNIAIAVGGAAAHIGEDRAGGRLGPGTALAVKPMPIW